MDAEASGILAKSLRANPRIESLNLRGTAFQKKEGHASLMNEIASHAGLAEVCVESGLSQGDLSLLMRGLENNKVLKMLTVYFSDLSGRKHDAEFVKATHEMLLNNDTLQELSLPKPMLSAAGGYSLSKGLEKNRGLLKLHIGASLRDPSELANQNAFNYMLDMLDSNTTIQDIDIDLSAENKAGCWELDEDEATLRQQMREKLERNRSHQ